MMVAPQKIRARDPCMWIGSDAGERERERVLLIKRDTFRGPFLLFFFSFFLPPPPLSYSRVHFAINTSRDDKSRNSNCLRKGEGSICVICSLETKAPVSATAKHGLTTSSSD